MYKILEKNKLFLVHLPLVLYWLILLIATTIPTVALESVFDQQDKAEHLAAYFLLTFLMMLSLHFQNRILWIKERLIVIALLIAFTYAALDELHQLLIPGRFCDILDWTADVIGSSLGALAAYYFIKRNSLVKNRV